MEDWRESIPEDLRAAPALKDVADVGSLAKQFVDLQAHMGNTMSMPKDDWTDTEYSDWAGKVIERSNGRVILRPDLTSDDQSEQFFRSLGKPETADGYDIPEGVDLSGIPTEQLNAIKNRMHEANITKDQWNRIAKDLADDTASAAETAAAELTKNLDRLKLKWGQNTEAKKQELADRLLQQNCPSCLVDDLKANRLTPEMTLFMESMVNQIGGERKTVGDDPAGTGQIRTPADIDAEIARLDERRRAIGHSDNRADRQEVQRIVDKQVQLRIERDKLVKHIRLRSMGSPAGPSEASRTRSVQTGCLRRTNRTR